MSSTTKGVVFALAAYSFLSFGDAFTKSLGGRVSIFQIGLCIALIGCAAVPIVKAPDQSWREATRIHNPLAVFARASTGFGAGVLGIFAFTHLPFTQAYALIFTAPLFTALMSILFLAERPSAPAWLAIITGFVGMLLIVRPGIQTPQLGHLAALGVAMLMATGVIILRTVAARESRSAILIVQMSCASVLYATGLAITGSAQWPTLPDAARLIGAGMLAFLGQAGLVAATAVAQASAVAPAQYVQLGWATLIGSMLFGERADPLTLAGLGVIGVSGLLAIRSAQHAEEPALRNGS